MGVVIRPVRVAGQLARREEDEEEDDDDAIGWHAPADSCWKVEKLAVELGAFRLTLELSLAGAILKHPRLGMLRADECGVSAGLFEREDARCMYLAAAYCHGIGQSDDEGLVLYLAKHGLQVMGYWDEQAKAFERGMKWSELNLVDLACKNDGPADVIEFARQLIDLDRRQRVAGKLWVRMWKVLDGVGKEIRSTKFE